MVSLGEYLCDGVVISEYFSLPPVLAYRMVALLAGYLTGNPRPAGFGAARPVSVWSGVATWLTAAPPGGL
jgi:hypothetical protein